MNDNITEINKDTFWALIQEAKDTCGQDTDAWAKYMIDRLAGLGPDQSLMFLNYMDAYKDLSFRYGLWDAAKIFRVDGCSDDSFSYFRSWLIVQGKDVYMAALADPDSLADVEPYADCFFETAGYVGAYAYKKLTGEYAFEHLDYDYLLALENELVKDIHYKEGIEYPRDWKALPGFPVGNGLARDVDLFRQLLLRKRERGAMCLDLITEFHKCLLCVSFDLPQG